MKPWAQSGGELNLDVSKVEERRKLGWVGTYHACTPSLSQKGLSRSRNTPVKLVYVSSSPLIRNCISWRADFSLHVKNVHRVIRSALPKQAFFHLPYKRPSHTAGLLQSSLYGNQINSNKHHHSPVTASMPPVPPSFGSSQPISHPWLASLLTSS